ncbi:MAG TPA: MurR/RpiR family transcriptional regulator [Chthoniobacterales bacterium]
MKSVREGLNKIVDESFETGLRVLRHTLNAIEIEFLERAVEALVLARRIYCYAVGSSGLLASEVEYRFVRLGMNCIAIHDPLQMAVQSSLISLKDVVIAFSQTGRNRHTVDGLAKARAAGATTIGITRKSGSPLLAVTDIPLVLEQPDRDSQDLLPCSKIAELVLVDALSRCVAMVRKSPASSQVDQNIERMLSGRLSDR